MSTEQALRGTIRLTVKDAEALKAVLRTAHNELFTAVRDRVKEVYASLGGTRSVDKALAILTNQYGVYPQKGVCRVIDFTDRDGSQSIRDRTATSIAASIVRDKIVDQQAVRKPTLDDITGVIPQAGRQVLTFGMYDAGGRMDAEVTIDGPLIHWESSGTLWPEDIANTFIARALFTYLDNVQWSSRTGGEILHYIMDDWDTPAAGGRTWKTYGNKAAGARR